MSCSTIEEGQPARVQVADVALHRLDHHRVDARRSARRAARAAARSSARAANSSSLRCPYESSPARSSARRARPNSSSSVLARARGRSADASRREQRAPRLLDRRRPGSRRTRQLREDARLLERPRQPAAVQARGSGRSTPPGERGPRRRRPQVAGDDVEHVVLPEPFGPISAGDRALGDRERAVVDRRARRRSACVRPSTSSSAAHARHRLRGLRRLGAVDGATGGRARRRRSRSRERRAGCRAAAAA